MKWLEIMNFVAVVLVGGFRRLYISYHSMSRVLLGGVL